MNFIDHLFHSSLLFSTDISKFEKKITQNIFAGQVPSYFMIGLNFQEICRFETCLSVNGHPIVPTFPSKKYGRFKGWYPDILGK